MVEVLIRCPLCGAATEDQSIRTRAVYGGDQHQRYWQCKFCGVIYLYPPTSQEEDNKFYETDFDKWMIKRSNDETWTNPATQYVKMQSRELPLRLPWLQKIVKPGDRVVEIGSSSGFVLSVIKDWGCDCVGIEISREYAEYSRQRGIKTYSSWADIVENDNFDTLLHYYVLEHVAEPLRFLEECLGHVVKHGKMMFEVPNANDPLISLYKVAAFDEFYWWRAHHWYFTPKSLAYVLDKLGKPYEIHAGQRYDISNHIHWMLTGKPGGLGKYNHIFSPETQKSYAEDLKKSWHCDYMIAIVTND